MPEEFDVRRGAPAPDVAVWMKLAEEARAAAAEKDEMQLGRRVLTPNGNCFRCHTPPSRELDIRPIDYAALSRTFAADTIRAKRIETQETAEAKEIAAFQKAEPLEKLVRVFARLPEKASLQIGENSLKFETDFLKFIQSIPGMKLEGVARELASGLKYVSLDGDRFTAQFDTQKKLPINIDIPMVGKLSDLSLGDKAGELKFDVELGSMDAKSISVKNITGLSLTLNGSAVAIREMTLDTSVDKPSLVATVDNPASRPSGFPEKLWPKTITVPIPLDKFAPGLTGTFLRNVLKTCSDARNVLKNKDFTSLLENVPEQGLRNTLSGLLKGVKSVEKNGDKVTIARDNGAVNHDLGGPSLTISPYTSFRIGSNPDAPKVFDIKGITFKAPLPSELGAGDKMIAPIKSLELGYKDRQGNRELAIKSDDPIERVAVKVTPQMQPVKDGEGNWNVDVRMTNLLSKSSKDKLDARIRLDSSGNLNMKPSEILDIVSRATYQATDLSLTGASMAYVSVQSKIASTVAWIFGW